MKVTISKFIVLQDYKETKDEIHDACARMSIIFSKPISYFKGIKFKAFKKYLNKVNKLTEDVKPSIKSWFFHNGMLYVRKDYQDLNNKEMVSINSILDSKMNEGIKIQKVLEILYRPFYKSKFTINDKFMSLDINKAQSHIIFFFSSGKSYYKGLLELYLGMAHKVKTREMNEQKALEIANVRKLLNFLRNGNGSNLSQYLQKEEQQIISQHKN